MRRADINSKLRDFAHSLSPTEIEQKFVSKVYGSLQEMLGNTNCIQIGSYPRYTATTPIHDLDILYVLGDWPQQGDLQDPDKILSDAAGLIQQNYKNFCPDNYTFTVGIQNHSVVVTFSGARNFVVDVVPCYSFGQNSYGQPMYKVPQIIKQRDRAKRRAEEWNPTDKNQWISSDPRGYIKQAENVGINADFRKAVKIVKFWKKTLRELDGGLKLKSFHLEQVITRQFQANMNLDLLQGIFDFFLHLPDTISNPDIIEDRAQAGKYIDDYLKDLTDAQKQILEQARDNVLVSLEEITEGSSAEQIFTAATYARNPDERFMFDEAVVMCNDPDSDLSEIRCDDQVNRRVARSSTHSTNDEKLYFKLQISIRSGYQYYWKVKNSNKLAPDKRRGDITLGRTKNYPETTRYEGLHYVECYAVNNQNECESRSRHNVSIGDS